MKIETLQLFSYDLPLKRPLILKSQTLQSRRGLLVEMTDEKGRKAVSDIAPLPFFNPETIPAILEAYSQLKEQLLKTHWSLKLLLSSNNILNHTLDYKRYPSLFFGIEFALLSLLMPKFCISPHVTVNRLLMGSDETILDNLQNTQDHEKIKIKIGPRSPDKMIELIEKMRLHLKPHQQLRIDGNRAWTLRQTLLFCEHFPLELCDYLEEPLQNPKEYLTLANYCSHPIGFDESLLDTPLNLLLSVPTKKAFIIKPTLIGSLQRMNFLYQKACKFKLDFILSSSFESGLGHLMIAHLSRYLGLQAPIGLDTYQWLKDDVLLDPLNFQKGQLFLEKENLMKPRLNSDILRPVYV